MRHQAAHTWGPEWRAVVPTGADETDPAVAWVLSRRAGGADQAAEI